MPSTNAAYRKKPPRKIENFNRRSCHLCTNGFRLTLIDGLLFAVRCDHTSPEPSRKMAAAGDR
jgi:hypothetical protein